MLLLALFVSSECFKGYKPLGTNKKSGGTKKSVKKIGELTLQGGLSVLSMSAALAFLDAMERSLSPGDTEGLERIMAERKAILESMRDTTSPWTLGGAAVCMLIICGGSLTWCKNKKRKQREAESSKEDKEEEEGEGGVMRFREVDPKMI